MAKGDFAGARADFERAAVLTPNYSLLEINRGVVAGATGDQAEAERHFLRALQFNPDADAHYFYARWLLERGRAAEALPHAREALRRSPGFADAAALQKRIESRLAFDRGLSAITSRDWGAAVAANREALALDPSSADACNNLGWALAQLGRRDEAARAYRQTLALRPGDARAQNNLRLLQQR